LRGRCWVWMNPLTSTRMRRIITRESVRLLVEGAVQGGDAVAPVAPLNVGGQRLEQRADDVGSDGRGRHEAVALGEHGAQIYGMGFSALTDAQGRSPAG
jgi:hypothetical protein